MNNHFGWQYSVFQHHPDTTRGECVNFGVLVKMLDTGRVLVRLTDDFTRLKALDPNFNEASHRIFFPPGSRETQHEPGPLKVHQGDMAEAMSMNQMTVPRGGIGDVDKETLEDKLEWAYNYFVAPIPAR